MARTRVFDIEEAIATATQLFWRNGYDQTSLADLTAAIGITAPSFYFAFGSKEGLFRRVLEEYLKTRLGYTEEALSQPTARGVADLMLHRLADLYTDAAHPPGCLAVNAAMPCTGVVGSVRDELTRLREARRERLETRFQEAKAVGDLPPDAEPDELARFLMVLAWGMAIDAQSGATRADLHRTVVRALTAWPN